MLQLTGNAYTKRGKHERKKPPAELDRLSELLAILQEHPEVHTAGTLAGVMKITKARVEGLLDRADREGSPIMQHPDTGCLSLADYNEEEYTANGEYKGKASRHTS